jgi:hypothetical protein
MSQRSVRLVAPWPAASRRLLYLDLVVQPDLVARLAADAPGMARRLEDRQLDVMGRDAGRSGNLLVDQPNEVLLGGDRTTLEDADLDDRIAARPVGRRF